MSNENNTNNNNKGHKKNYITIYRKYNISSLVSYFIKVKWKH
jgi:hypothetical protein